MRFPLGTITVSLTAASALAAWNLHLFALLTRHGQGDSGVSPLSDAEDAIKDGKEVFSAYELPGTKAYVCISTEPNRSATSVILSTEDY